MNTENILEFHKIKEALAELAMTKRAKEEATTLTPYLSITEVKARLHETKEAKEMINRCQNPPATALDGVSEWIDIADKGGCLMPDQLESIAMVLAAVRRMKDYLNRCKQYKISLAYYEENLDSLDDLYEEIGQKIRGGRVDDYASKLLKSIRDELERLNAKMHEKADAVLRSHKDCMSDNFCTTRNGHLCVPVKKEYKAKVNGAVIDKSSTGSTLFIEPASVAAMYTQIQELVIDEDNEERRILYELSSSVALHTTVFEVNNATIEKLDFIFAKAKLSLEMNATEPHINTDRVIRIRGGRHPLMDQKQCVPLNFEIGNGVNGIIITGPNTGGKTVAIKTVALTCMMAQSGLHVTSEEADICMNNDFLCDIGDGQSISENLSTFSSHITNVIDILRRVTPESLVVMDELGSGTDPAEGMGIAIAILDELKKSKALFLVTTHYPQVKEYAKEEEGIVNARMTFDKETLNPLYQLVIGEAGESCAFYIAGKLGMPQEMLNRAAEAAYGLKGVDQVAGLGIQKELKKTSATKITKEKKITKQVNAGKFRLGDSVMVMPDRKIGIVCGVTDEKGVLHVQLQNKKIYINHKRIQLLVAATELYPEDYDFSIVFDSVEVRKKRHEMERKYTDTVLLLEDEKQ